MCRVSSDRWREAELNMKKKVTVLLSALLFVFCFSAGTQQPKKIPRIGYLVFRDSPGPGEKAFLQGLQDLGYVEGKTIVIEWRRTTGKPELLADLAAELVRLKVDVLVAAPTPAVQAAKNANEHHPYCYGVCCRSGGNRVCCKPCTTGREHHGSVRHYAGACGEAVGAA